MAEKGNFNRADPNLVKLFRYLGKQPRSLNLNQGLKHRSENPLNQEHYEIDGGLRHLLDRAICETGAKFMLAAY
jgi:hypothetical protein